MTSKIKYELSESPDLTVKMPCLRCDGRTTHSIVSLYKRSGQDGSFDFFWTDTYEVVQCKGCDEISFRKTSSNSEDLEPVSETDWEYVVHEDFYPPRTEGLKGLGDEVHYLPYKILSIYRETLKALTSGSPILAGIGLRALLEAICKDNEAEGANLFKQIDDLVVKKLLTPKRADVLHKIRALGNKAAHEISPNTEKQLGLAMSIVEHLLQEVYILPEQAAREFKGA